MKKLFNVGDLVRFQHPSTDNYVTAKGLAAQERYVRRHMPYQYEIGIVIANDCVQGCVVSFPSRITPVSTLSLEVL